MSIAIIKTCKKVIVNEGNKTVVKPTIRKIVINKSKRGPAGISADNLTATAGANILSHQPVALINDLAYPYDASNLAHMFAFVGFSQTSANFSQNLVIKRDFIELASWGLTPNTHYRAGVNGAISTASQPLTAQKFSKIIGHAVTATKLKIILDNNPIKTNA